MPSPAFSAQHSDSSELTGLSRLHTASASSGHHAGWPDLWTSMDPSDGTQDAVSDLDVGPWYPDPWSGQTSLCGKVSKTSHVLETWPKAEV